MRVKLVSATASLAALLIASTAFAQNNYSFRHFAGNPGGIGFADGSTPQQAMFNYPYSLAVAADGTLFVADENNLRIRQVDPDGTVSTLLGNGQGGIASGTGSNGTLAPAMAVTVGTDGNLFVATRTQVFRLTRSGTMTVFAGDLFQGTNDGVGTNARFSNIEGLAVDPSNNLYVSDSGGCTIRRVAPDGTVTTIAGLANSCSFANGTGTAARFNKPYGLVVAPDGNIYVADEYNACIRQMTPAGVVTTVAGSNTNSGFIDGTGSGASFYHPTAITVDPSGNFWIGDAYNHAVRKMTPSYVVTTQFGNGTAGFVDGTIATARLQYPVGVAAAPNGDVYVGDQNQAIHRIRGTTITTITGVPSPNGAVNGTGAAARFDMPWRIASDASGNLYVTEFTNQCIRKITPAGVVTAFAGSCTSPGISGLVNANGTAARFNGPAGLRFGPGGNLYVADANNSCIRMVTPLGDVTTWSIGSFTRPNDIVFDSSGNAFVAEDYRIMRVDAVTMAITVFAGAGSPGGGNGTGTAASFDHAEGIAIDASNNLYVSEYYTHDIRKITPGAVVTTLAGTNGSSGNTDGSSAKFWSPAGLEFGPSGDLYVADSSNCMVRRVNVTTGFVTTEAGKNIGRVGAQDGVGIAATFNQVPGITFDPSGRMYLTDELNHCIRIGLPVLADSATIDSPSSPLLVPRQLDTSPQTASAWTWNVIRRPGGSHVNVSDTAIRNPTFTPDASDLYIFEVEASNGTQGRISRVQFMSCNQPPPPPVVTSSANPSCPGSGVTLTASDGFTSYLWSTGATTKSITVAPSATTSYTVTGYSSVCATNPTTYVQNVYSFDAPTNVTATPTGPNKITVAWTASTAPGVHHYDIYRLAKACAVGGTFTSLGTSTGTSFDDTTANAGVTYAYEVRAADSTGNCKGPFSGCDDAIAYGACSTKPTFTPGLASVTANGCLLRLSWPPATSNCPLAPAIVYDVYRSNSFGFTPDPSNLIARCVTNTFYDDNTAPAGTSYYIVHAEDATTNGGGSCNDGNEDANTSYRGAAPSGGVSWSAYFTDTFDTGGRPPSPDTYWTASNAARVALSTCRSASPSTSYKFGPAACAPAVYDNSQSTTLTFGDPNPTTGGFVIPSGARLRFNKMIQAESGWDGVALYYGLSPTGPWTYISDTPTGSAPYVATGPYTGNASSQGGARTWTGTASTNFSETTVDLSWLASKRVWFQWKFTTDTSGQYEGIYIDDVNLETSTPISCPILPSPVTVLSSTTRNGQTQIDFLTPPSNYASTAIRYQIGLLPPMTTTGGSLVGNWIGTADAHGSILHQPLTNGTTYAYAAFVASPDGQTAPIRTVRSRPIDTSGPIKWIYNTGATATSAPGIKTGVGGISYVASNDRAFHSFVNGAAGGSWPATWKPFAMNGPSQSRTLPFEIVVSGVQRQVVAAGSHDGRVYLVDANNGSVIWTSPILGDMVQASPVAISTVYGAPFGLVMVGSRSADGSSNVYGLHPDDGHIVWTYDDSPLLGGSGLPIGIINDAIVFDYVPKPDGWRRLYFTSRANPSGNSKTLWCLKFNGSTVSKDWAISTAGDTDAFPMPVGANLYVGNTRGDVWAIRTSDQTPVWGPVATNDGPVKVTLWPDANNRLYFSTTNNLWCIGTDGVIKWQKTLPTPSTPNRFGDYIYLGAGDGKVYEISNLLAPTAAGLVVKSVTLGDPAAPGIVGEPTLDRANGLIYVGTDSGSVYAVAIPFP